MPITYADVPMDPPSGAQQAAMEWYHTHRINEYEYQGFLVPGIQHLPTPYLPQREPPRVGVLRWPAGIDQFATCHLVIHGVTLLELRMALGLVPAAFPLVFTDNAGGSISADMYLIGVRPISDRNDGRDLYLITLVDQRYFWWQTGSTEIGTAPSWDDLILSLYGLLGITPSAAPVPAAYLTPNASRWDIGTQPIPPVIQAACTTVGLRPVRLRTGQSVVQSYETAIAYDDARWSAFKNEVISGGRIVGQDVARGLPSEVDTCFFDGTAVTNTLSSFVLIQAGGIGGVTGWVGRITADPDSPTNSQKTAYGLQASYDYYRWAFSLTDATFRGFLGIEACGLDDSVEWIHTPDQMVTRVLRSVWSDRNIYGSVPGATGVSGSGTPDEYQDECLNGYLIRKKAYLQQTSNGLSQTQYQFDKSFKIPCGDQGTSGSGPPETSSSVSSVCVKLGSVRLVGASYTITYSDDILQATASGIVITLPAIADGNGPGADWFFIKNASGGSITVEGGGTTIDASTSVSLSSYEAITVYSDGSAWYVL